MNCNECRDLLPAFLDESLDGETVRSCKQHLDDCPACRAECERVQAMEGRLAAHGARAANVSVVSPVMRRVRAGAAPARRSLAWLRWFVGIGATAVAAVAVTLLVLPARTNAQATDVVNRGLATLSHLASVHLEARMRTPARDNFAAIRTDADFVSVSLWREFDGAKRWRVEKPERVAAMNGTSTVLFVRPDRAMKIDRATQGAFDTGWLQRVADIEQTLSHAMTMVQTKAWTIDLAYATGTSGAKTAIVTIDTTSGVPPTDYLANAFIGTANLRQVYRFDDQTGRLQALQIYLRGTADVLVFETTGIEYNQPLAAAVFEVAVPENVTWVQQTPAPAAPKYSTMTAETAARTFFEACGRDDWTEADVFLRGASSPRLRAALGGLTVVSIGESFTSAASAARFVPYEIKLQKGQVKKFNLALKRDAQTGRWFVDGGI